MGNIEVTGACLILTSLGSSLKNQRGEIVYPLVIYWPFSFEMLRPVLTASSGRMPENGRQIREELKEERFERHVSEKTWGS